MTPRRFYPKFYAVACWNLDALHRILSASDTPLRDVAWGAEWLGAKWTPDRWWPTLCLLLRSESAYDRETALNAIEGRISRDGNGVDRSFYERQWPHDVVDMRDVVLTELRRVSKEDAVQSLRDLACELANELHHGSRWWDDEEPQKQ